MILTPVTLLGKYAHKLVAAAVQAKDWDKLVAEVKKEEKDEQPDGDAGVQKLFRQIYASACSIPSFRAPGMHVACLCGQSSHI